MSNKKIKVTQDDIERAHTYMHSHWCTDEGFTDLMMISQAGDTELLAHYLVGSGAIDSNHCFDQFKKIEKIVETLAEQYLKLNKKEQEKRLNDCFKNSIVVRCNKCGCVQFVDEHNFQMYKKELKKSCWDCDNKSIQIYNWGK